MAENATYSLYCKEIDETFQYLIQLRPDGNYYDGLGNQIFLSGSGGGTVSTVIPIYGNGVSAIGLSYSTDFDIATASSALELNLAFTTLPSISISSLWSVRKNDNITGFPSTTISGNVVTNTMSATNITVPTGVRVYYGGTASIGSIGVGSSTPTLVTGNWSFIPNPPITYPNSSYLTQSNLVSNTTLNLTIQKPKTGFTFNGSNQLIRATGNDISSTNTTVTFNDVLYFGTVSTFGPGNITQAQADTISATAVQGVTNFRFGGKAQTLTPVIDSVNNRICIAYLATYGDLTHMVLNGAVDVFTSYYKRTNDLVITTLSGITASYRVYVARADNSYPVTPTQVLVTS